MSIESLVNLDWQWLRVFNGSDSLFWDGFMATCTAGLTWLPMYLALAYMIVRNGDDYVFKKSKKLYKLRAEGWKMGEKPSKLDAL